MNQIATITIKMHLCKAVFFFFFLIEISAKSHSYKSCVYKRGYMCIRTCQVPTVKCNFCGLMWVKWFCRGLRATDCVRAIHYIQATAHCKDGDAWLCKLPDIGIFSYYGVGPIYLRLFINLQMVLPYGEKDVSTSNGLQHTQISKV